ncbi:acylphosphatase [Rhizobium hidalgonense]|uniref:Acylphosphatase n=1 Tax=Rhizobium hidalgonense TaxID=1538159 RepID=A0A2A6KJE2_9HYPH|nr:acylphosphatase [Rhizobium hidalgonense]MDR9772063.1 acylphosphatase [Rhizobium hidalgonense]MDR9810121.1 acylphosphatase [Rhizobium hidalgonense]MDR9817851.1 acylphosphatase [Rhizobium hidalgonense]PDT25006.1 acylphosphatase [Rhizobium hidalgonense]PON06163.1 acylphosphatase [Rhizobium hidalgonense]
MGQVTSLQQRMTIVGDLNAASFVPWIRRHAAKLGLSHHISHTSSMRIEVEVSGPEDLIDMMEVGCSLGPIDVWVESIERTAITRETAQRQPQSFGVCI